MAPNATVSLLENHDGSHGGDRGENLEDKSRIFCLSAPQETKNEHTLASFGAHTLTLYKFKIDVPEMETIKKSNEGHISGCGLPRQGGAQPSVLKAIGHIIFNESNLPTMTIHIILERCRRDRVIAIAVHPRRKLLLLSQNQQE